MQTSSALNAILRPLYSAISLTTLWLRKSTLRFKKTLTKTWRAHLFITTPFNQRPFYFYFTIYKSFCQNLVCVFLYFTTTPLKRNPFCTYVWQTQLPFSPLDSSCCIYTSLRLYMPLTLLKPLFSKIPTGRIGMLTVVNFQFRIPCAGRRVRRVGRIKTSTLAKTLHSIITGASISGWDAIPI